MLDRGVLSFSAELLTVSNLMSTRVYHLKSWLMAGTQNGREALRFSAYLRQPHETPKAEKDAYVEEVISLLEMEDIADAIIGDPTVGLPVADRKRVTIGVELAAKPQLLLFLDEPSSGLDSQSAFNIVRFLRKLAGAGQA